MNIAFFESITSYYVDMHNYLHDNLNFKIYYIYKDFLNHNTEELSKSLNFNPCFLSSKGKNSFRFKELIRIIKDNRPKNVITVEYSLLTLQLIIIKFLYRYDYNIIVRTDDSIDMLKHSLTIKHKIAKSIMTPMVDNFILCDKKVFDYYQEKTSKGAYFPIIRDEQKLLKELDKSQEAGEQLIIKNNLQNKKIIIFVGRLVPVKNISAIFKAINRIERDDFIVTIIGDGELRKELETEAKDSKHRIIFTGNLTGIDLLSWYKIANILILPSWQEAFGAVVNEAMVAKCFPIVSERAGSKSLINNGVNGYIFNPNDDEDLVKAIEFSLEHVKLEKDNNSLMNITFSECANNIANILKKD